jgi:hypothetical protein
VKLTPPSNFENGQYGGGSGPAETMRYTIILSYHPQPGDECKCVGFILRGYYLHTYDGEFECSCANALSVEGGFPWGVSLGGSLSFANDTPGRSSSSIRAATDPNHTKTYEPVGWVPSA